MLLQPAHGQYVYIYESVQAAVQPGQPVQAGQVIGFGSATSSSTGIEIGFADASGAPLAHGVYIEGAVTAWGQRMDAFRHRDAQFVELANGGLACQQFRPERRGELLHAERKDHI